ncbi:DUF2190 family protein [Deltaproteobacteria bacterium OttesenSCG-928-M10]|nr:DUF2190 family protein [Deltaproteobacteria bacterium OttesenSCG-928-M10]
MQNMNRKGQTLTWRNDTGADVKGGQLLIIGDVVGVAARDITKDALGAVVMEGVFRLPKAAGAVTAGARVYVDDAGAITATAGDHPAGVAWAPAAAADTALLVKINV